MFKLNVAFTVAHKDFSALTYDQKEEQTVEDYLQPGHSDWAYGSTRIRINLQRRNYLNRLA